MSALTPRELEVLRFLDDINFETPRMIGGRDGSHHSSTLARLATRGLAERKKVHAIHCPNGTTQRSKWNGKELVDWISEPYKGCRCKGHCRYQRTPAGKDAVREALDAQPTRSRRR